MTWWGWWRRRRTQVRARADQAEAELRRVQSLTPRFESLANEMRVPPEELATRLAHAFLRRIEP